MGNKEPRQSASRPRKRLFVNAKIQGALLAHTALYWGYCLLSVGVIAVAWIVLLKQPTTSADLFQDLWENVGPALIGAFTLLPLVLLDCLRLSNRFAGPMVRIQRCMKQLANGESPAKIKLRDGDFWCEFADDLNRVIDRISANESVEVTRVTADPTERPATAVEPKVAAPLPVTPAVAPPLEVAQISAANIYSDFA